MIITDTAPRVDARTLVPAPLLAKLTARIAVDHPELAADMPARIMDQALALLGTCAVTTEPIGPSDIVDMGWHTFILYTREYAEFCHRVAGRFIHHVPDDNPEVESHGLSLSGVVDAIRAAGYEIDDELWSVGAKCDDSGGDGNGSGKCSQCHKGCVDSN